MAEMSRTFNFDDFDAQIAEALANNAEAAQGIRRPGEIGAVAANPTLVEVTPIELDK